MTDHVREVAHIFWEVQGEGRTRRNPTDESQKQKSEADGAQALPRNVIHIDEGVSGSALTVTTRSGVQGSTLDPEVIVDGLKFRPLMTERGSAR